MRRLRRRAPLDRQQWLAVAVATLSGAVVFFIASVVFPYHSVNHDEGVYLMQAAMLLEGQLELFAGDLSEAFRPWFFVEDGGRLYSKYGPVPSALFAVSMALFGEPRVTLAVIAAGSTLFVSVLGSMAFDRRVGVVAGLVFAAAPMTLFTSSVFLPYAPTTFLNLAFAVGYLHGVRTGSTRSAAAAGIAVGLAFFARPYTAVLFAAPFILHAVWTIGRSLRRDGLSVGRRPNGSVRHRLHSLPDPVRRNALTALGGLAFVGVTLAYNLRITGSPLVFPYQAFAPLDGPGFGYREILDHSVEYTPALAIEANSYALQYLGTRWFTGGLLGTAAAVVGLVVAIRRWRWSAGRVDPTVGLLLAGLFVSVPLGNIPFWGNYNMLATLSDPTTGLVAHFGPFYYFDLLAPLSVFGAFGFVTGWRAIRGSHFVDRLAARFSARTARRLTLAVLVASVLVVGGANATLLGDPLEENIGPTEKYEVAYEPIEETEFDNALVFIPDPYGPWQNHPFQSLRNDPGLDGEVVYALDRDPAGDFEVLDAYPNRTTYRYDYRGEWTPNPNDYITPKLEPLDVRRGDSLAGETTVGIPNRISRATVRLETDREATSYDLTTPTDNITVDWRLTPNATRLETVTTTNQTTSTERTLSSNTTAISVDDTDEIRLLVTLFAPDGSSFTYRQEAAVRSTDGGSIEAVWPPERTVCTLVTRCGSEGTYLPDSSDAHSSWVDFETQLEATA
ncbi:ArnT family glycosyltransferase [Halohasta litchfieldiae]|uniref:Dolichyl-phosphate-mannose-protein mannosyltransferase n=1 Tax=Halohasta litchfieldiae TaxID=1073996 RepID=A0A1H6RCP3_9EURY|nr:glycosyltransferase family 39 protein [Halohasta litchfieldiae]SEI48952.1 Dolichyl-phosphate-mannose-protein mannosyltransferase [Halohasta litchfieldiae]